MDLKILYFILIPLIGYLLGSFNFSIIISRVFAKTDVRTLGSGNAGMTNILRNFGKKAAIATFVGDVVKCVIAVLLGRWIAVKTGIMPTEYATYLASLGAILGHVFPLYFGFQGGKAVATSAAAALMMNPVAFVTVIALFLIVAKISKIISVGSLAAAFSYPVIVFVVNLIFHRPIFPEIVIAFAIAAFIVYLHRGNIKRILNGEEKKMSKQDKTSDTN